MISRDPTLANRDAERETGSMRKWQEGDADGTVVCEAGEFHAVGRHVVPLQGSCDRRSSVMYGSV